MPEDIELLKNLAEVAKKEDPEENGVSDKPEVENSAGLTTNETGEKGELGSPTRSLLPRLRQMLPQLSPTERQIGDYVLEHPRQALRLPMDQLAREIGVSQGTLSNFSQTLGYSGFKAFRLDLAAEVNSPLKLDYSTITRGDNLQEIANKAISADIDALLTTLKSLDMAEVERAIEALKQARRIELYGIGISSIVSLDAFTRFKGLDLTVSWLPDISHQIASAVLLTNQDVAIAFSASGDTKAVIEALSLAHQHGATTIMITGNPNSALARYSDIRLVATPREASALSRNLRTSARIAMLGIVDILYLGLINAMDDAAFERIKRILSYFGGASDQKKT